MSAAGGSLAQFLDGNKAGKLPKLVSQAARRAGVLKAGKAFRKHQRTTVAKKRKLFQRELKKLAAKAKP